MRGNIFQRTMALAVTIAIALAMAVGTSVAASASSGPYPIKLLEPANGIFSPAGMAIDPITGALVTANPFSGTVGILPKQTGTIFGQAVTANVDVPLYAATGLDNPAGVVFDAAGDLFISNAGYSDSITVIARTSTTIFGQSFTANVPTVLAASNGIITPMGMAFDAAGDLFVAASNGNGWISVIPKNSGTIFGQAVTANQTVTLTAASTTTLGNPFGVAFDPSGNLFISYQGSIRIIPVASGTLYGQSVTANTAFDLTGLGTQIQGIAVDANDDIFYADEGSPTIGVYSPTAGTIFGVAVAANTPQPILTSQDPIGYPQAVLLDGSGNLYISGWIAFGNTLGSVLFLAPTATTLYGQQVAANSLTQFHSPAPLNFPYGIARDSHGNIFVASALGGQILVDPATTGTLFGQSVTAGVIAVLNATAGVSVPEGLAVDAAGNLYIASESQSEIAVLAPNATTIFGQQVPADTVTSLTATNGSSKPDALAFDAAGNLYIGDGVTGPNLAVVAPSATTILGQQVPAATFTELSASTSLTSVSALSIDSSGRIFVGTLEGTLWVLSPTPGTVLGTPVAANAPTQIDDGLSALARNEISGLSIDAAGNLYIAALQVQVSGQTLNGVVGVISPAAATILGQDVPATTFTAFSSAANISLPFGVMVVPDGSLYMTSATGFWEIANLASPPVPVIPANLAATGFSFGSFLLASAAILAVGVVLVAARRPKRTA